MSPLLLPDPSQINSKMILTRLHLDLNATLGSRGALGKAGQQVSDVIPGVTVQASAQALLVKEVGNETDRASEDEETVQDTHAEVVLSLLGREGAAVAEQVNEADSNTTIDVENKVVLLGGGDGLDSKGVVEELVAGEVGKNVLLDQLNTEIRVVAGLDTVTDTRDELVGLTHAVDEFTRGQALVERLGELLSSTVKSTTETGANGQQTRDERRNQVLAGTGSDDGVHGTGHGGTVIGSEHEDHLQELGGVLGEPAAEPQERHDTTNANLLLEDVGDGHTSIQQLLTTVVGNGRDESSRLTDEAKLLSPRVVHRNLGNSRLGLRLDGALLDELLVDLGES